MDDYTQLHNQYCYKYGIPYLDEIIGLRKHLNLTVLNLRMSNQSHKLKHHLMLFILQHSNNIGIETMQTLLYNIDYCSLRKRGMALTGLCIQKCDSTGSGNLMELLSVLRDEISWQPSTEDNPADIVLKSNASPDMSIFNEDEMAVINCALANPDRKLPQSPADFRSFFE